MSYRGKREGNYGNRSRGRSFGAGFGKRKGNQSSDTERAKRNFEQRSQRSQTLDLLKVADLAPNISMYLKSPERFDWCGVDMADARLIFSRKSIREKASDLARLAKIKPLELWVKNTGEADIKNIDTPNAKTKGMQTKILRKFRIVRKQPEKEKPKETEKPKEAEKPKTPEKVEQKQTEKSILPKELDVNNPLSDGSKMPSHKEIVELAQQLYMKDHARFGETTLPTEADLKSEEADYLRKAQVALMTSESGKAEKKVMAYVDDLRNQLNALGFDVVPIAGFEL